MQYHIDLLKERPRQVEAWCIKRPPFEPQGWQQDFREDLRNGVKSLVAGPGDLLHALYQSPVHSRCDTENVLFYNIGAACFGDASRHAVRFERSFSCSPNSPVALSERPLHYLKYVVVPSDTPLKGCSSDAVMARWELQCADKKAFTKCATMWLAMKKTHPHVRIKPSASPQTFGLRVKIGGPENAHLKLVPLMKPVFDGIISAFHQHDGSAEDEIIKRLSLELKVHSEKLAGMLRDDSCALLGKRRLIWPYRNGVQWNPQDENCLVGELSAEYGKQTNWTLTGELFVLSGDPT